MACGADAPARVRRRRPADGTPRGPRRRRAASHPDSHRRSRSFTGSTGRWLRSGRGLSPPVRNCTDPGARVGQVCRSRSAVSPSARCAAAHPEMRWIPGARGAPLVRVHAPTPEILRGLAARRRGGGARSRSSCTAVRCTGRTTSSSAASCAGSGSTCAFRTGNDNGTTPSAARSPVRPGSPLGVRALPYAWELPVDVDADGLVVARPREPVADDPMWQDYQFVAMLDPVELADGGPATSGRTGRRMPCPPLPWTSAASTGRPASAARRGGPR